MNAKKPEQILRSTVASFAELRRLNALTEERRLRLLRQRADAISRASHASVVPVTVKSLHIGPVNIPVLTLASIRPGYGIVGK